MSVRRSVRLSGRSARLIAGVAGALLAVLGLGTLGAVTAQGGDVLVAVGTDVQDRVPGAGVPGSGRDGVLPDTGTQVAVPSESVLTARLRPLITSAALGRSAAMHVLDPRSGQELAAAGGTSTRTPASTAKLLTGAAALSALGPHATLTTRVVRGAARDEVVLIGGGDVLLAAGAGRPDAVNGHAGLADLAAAAARQLRAAGTPQVRVRLDDRLFAGPPTARGWSGGDVGRGFVAPVHAIEVDAGRLRDEPYAPRSRDPGLAAGQQFAAALEKTGVRVTGPVTRAAAPRGGTTLGVVESASVGDLVEHALTESDNTVAEALGRLVALENGEPATFAGAGAAVIAEMRELGVPTPGAVMSDASGLGDGSRLAPVTLTGVLAAAVDPERAMLRPLLSGLPVAGVSGTLVDRFEQRGTRAAAGVVRAKTGSLLGVSSLAGTLVDADGRLLVFAVLAQGVPATEPARRALDDVASTIAACGCR